MSSIFSNRFVQVLTLVLILQALLFYTASHGDARVLASPLEKFPAEIPGFHKITDGVVDQDTRAVLKADDVLSRFWVRSSIPDASRLVRDHREAAMTNAVELFIAYFSTQQQGQSPHSPKNCLPGAGWQAVDTGTLEIPINGLAKPVTINKYIIAKGASQSLVAYWYQSHGRVVADEYAAKFYLVADSVRYHRSDTALVRVVSPIQNDDLAGALDNVTAFVQSVLPVVYKYLPM